MFDVSFSEFAVVGALAVSVFGPREAISLLKNMNQHFDSMKKAVSYYLEYIDLECSSKEIEGEQEKHNIVDYIIDLDGNLQPTYNLDEIMPELKSYGKKKKETLQRSAI